MFFSSLLIGLLWMNGSGCEAPQPGKSAVQIQATGPASGELSECQVHLIREIGRQHLISERDALVTYLDRPRSLTPAERAGIFRRPFTPGEQYPAVAALVELDAPAELFLPIIRERGVSDRRGYNAFYASMAIRIKRAAALTIVGDWMQLSRHETKPSNAANLKAAAKEAMKWCSESEKLKCIALLEDQ